MLKHENPNIEIINPHLWAVRFSLIPMIPQISWKPDPSVNLNDTPCEFTHDFNIVLLNKDFKFYELVKWGYSKVMKMKPKAIRKELERIGDHPKNHPADIVYWGCLKGELARREELKKKKVISHDS